MLDTPLGLLLEIALFLRPDKEPIMPGYLSNRLVSFIPAEKAVVDAADLVLQEQIDDLSLNLGV